MKSPRINFVELENNRVNAAIDQQPLFTGGPGFRMDTLSSSAMPIATQLHWYLLKLPLTLALIVLGFLLEAAITWPFALLCRLHAGPRPR